MVGNFQVTPAHLPDQIHQLFSVAHCASQEKEGKFDAVISQLPITTAESEQWHKARESREREGQSAVLSYIILSATPKTNKRP